MDVTRPETLLRKTGDPQAAICLIIVALNFGFVNLRTVFFCTNGIIATNEHVHIEIEVASAEPTTSILKYKRNIDKSPNVRRLQPIFIIILVFTKPLIRR